LREGQVSFFTVRLKPELDAAARDRVRQAIERDLPVVVSDTEELLDRDLNYEILQAISSAVSLVALVSGAVSLLATLLISVQERTREIGMMAAIGWSDGRIVALIVMEGVLIGLAGCIAGVALGVAASALFVRLPAIGGFVSFTPRAADMALPLLFALPLCAAGAAYPAWRAVRLMPADALRRA
jgi:putative ABC transport system permease protein